MTKNRKRIKFLYQSLMVLIISFAIVSSAFKVIYFNRIFINLTLVFFSIITVMMISIFITESLKANQENDFKYVVLSMSFIISIHEIFVFWQYRESGLGLLWNLAIIGLLLGFAVFHLIVVSSQNLIEVYVNLEVVFITEKNLFSDKVFSNSLALFFIKIILIFNNKVKQLIRSWLLTQELISTFKVVLLTKYMKSQLFPPKVRYFLIKKY
ncbi:hypothetical protein LD125_00261 [Mesoplasma sp. JKS002658]|uniref:hypothetical protein n=2 Tax=Mesoplasma whartonense TaxID=2878854 RepID=UPI002022AE4C|nr:MULTISPECIES: hypothetical protein [unclassified Mesoplasma]MCL8214571.1 hypothetical protein [Mesoplasma sp. JKS002663]MCL8211233.1 hypothetical protein [Mesoplasma sp. JKS002664]MCL8211894.1 hypothetical protein [Mesoplasma sp. JKS002662]MCL8214001.1 hypothetical protein [Mesoplasma sp. JKS002658]MCL8215320.1 hypothetical protein [Mesoplasma sp. JKS002659]